MKETKWDRCTDPRAMLESLPLDGRVTERKLRLFGAACCRRVWGLFTDDRCRAAVEVAERYADGLATPSEVEAAWRGANVARDLAFGPASTAPLRHRSWLGRTTSWAAYALVSLPRDGDARLYWAWAGIAESAEYARDIRGKVRELKACQAGLLRDIFGRRPLPPLHGAGIDRSVLSWNGGTIPELARAAYEERRLPEGILEPARLGVLVDALEEAGCTNGGLLSHFRQHAAVHVRGCWALDLLLDKS